MQAAGWEIASHGLKWVEHRDMPEEEGTRSHRRGDPPAHAGDGRPPARLVHRALFDETPSGWWPRPGSSPMSPTNMPTILPLLAPGWTGRDQVDRALHARRERHCRFAIQAGFAEGAQFERYIRDSFDCLHAEGVAGRPAMLSIGLHCRLAGRPGRAQALKRALDHMAGHEGVWFATARADRRSLGRDPSPRTPGCAPPRWNLASFVAEFGGIFEQFPLDRRARPRVELGPAHDSATGSIRRCPASSAQRPARRAWACSGRNPDLARETGGGETADPPESTAEQARRGAGCADRCGTGRVHAAERGIRGEVRLSLHHRGARP